MAQSPKEYFEQLCKEAGMDDTSTAALVAAASNEKLSPKLSGLIKTAQDDYSAQLGRVKALEADITKWKEWGGNTTSQYQTLATELQKAKADLASITNDPNPNSNLDLTKYLTKDDLTAVAKEMGERYAKAIKSTGRIASRHAARYSEELDTEAVDKLAGELGLSLEAAYDKWIEPREKEKNEKALNERIQRERKEAVEDWASRHQLPVDPGPVEQSPIFHTHVKADLPANQDADLLAAWHGTK